MEASCPQKKMDNTPLKQYKGKHRLLYDRICQLLHFGFIALRGRVLVQTYESFRMESYWIIEWLFKLVASRENGLEKQGF